MKTDLDTLMSEKNIDALLVTGPAQHNPAMVYLTGGGHLTDADLLKKRGEPAVLFHAPMERDEAARSGLRTISYTSFPLKELLNQSKGDRLRALALRYCKMLEEQGFQGGRVLLYGRGEVGRALALFNILQELMPGLSLVGEADGGLLMEAMATKDSGEIARIRRMGMITTEVVAETQDFLSAQTAKNGRLVDREGDPITIGRVKKMINRWLSERGAENPEGTIFAQGRDAGVPHSSGSDADPLCLGQTIVFDIFPCEAGGGYFYDFTRTWCLGHAPDEAQKLYADVLSVYRQVRGELAVGRTCAEYQARACELFEAQGHATVAKNPATEEGYVHSLGHGVGLHIHERPWFNASMQTQDTLQPGMVFTVEPGLYYPERGLGVRLEDSVWVTPEGKVETLVEYPMDLVIPVK